MDFERWESKEK
uniref:Uncharacterized protein n=1 Tax=Rhizophora mucronata TaxID=61149 RepID=A0A2P2NEL4_RHIMU